MADDNTQPSGSPTVTDAGGGTLRVQPNTAAEEHNPTLEEQALEQERANETPEDKAKREAAEAGTPKEGEEGAAQEEQAPEAFDFTGSPFEGMSDEMKGKVAPFAAAYAENGTLTDAEVAEAAKATGFSEAAVRQFMAGAPAVAAQSAAPIVQAFGGMDSFREFQQWTQGEGTLTPAEERSINKALGVNPDGTPNPKLTPDYETAAQLMQAPMDRWKAAGGGAAARDVTREGGAGKAGGAEGETYANWAQVKSDMADPKYEKDPAFRANVQAKLGRSNNL